MSIMTVEIIGMVGTQDVSESRGDPGGPAVDVDYLTRFARALMRYRAAGVDTILIRGFDPLEDVVGWGREPVPRIRDLAVTTPVGGASA